MITKLFSYHYRPAVFGLDFSDHVVKAVELRHDRHGVKLRALAERGIPDGWCVDGEIHEPSKIAQLIRTMLAEPLQGKFSTKACVASLPEQHTFVKLITLGTFAPEERAEAVRWAASQHLPFNIEEVELDAEFHPELGAGKDLRVLIGAAPKNLVESVTTVLTSAGLHPVGLDLESTALARAMAAPHDKATEFIIDLGGNRTTVCIVYQGVVHFSSNLPFSGENLTRTVASRLHLSTVEAEKAKRIFGLSTTRGRGRVRAALLPEFHALSEKLREIITFTQNHFPTLPPVQRVSLAGGGALLGGVRELFAEELKLPIEEFHVAVQDTGSKNELPVGLRMRFSTAIGLALQQPKLS